MYTSYIFYITIVFLFHFILINPLEKLLTYTILDRHYIRRPEKKCIRQWSLECIGMPSGHSECIVIICILLLQYNLLDIVSCILIIIGIGLQRVYSKRHTLLQVIAGWSIGAIYSILYVFVLKNYSILKTKKLFK